MTDFTVKENNGKIFYNIIFLVCNRRDFQMYDIQTTHYLRKKTTYSTPTENVYTHMM